VTVVALRSRAVLARLWHGGTSSLVNPAYWS